MPRHIIIKMQRLKTNREFVLKVVREKQLVTLKETPIRLLAHFSTATLQAGRGWQKLFSLAGVAQ